MAEPLRRSASRTKLSASRCSHKVVPVLVERDAAGAERARCLRCGATGPLVHAGAF